ncbi:hypothetical protein V1478_013279 [Vespula squamosa]|uniref:Uncharacterized protein n=1 Tax=Vespula squamosa TaxID=30214 RepID=A0ABD2AAD4_VESSQ
MFTYNRTISSDMSKRTRGSFYTYYVLSIPSTNITFILTNMKLSFCKISCGGVTIACFPERSPVFQNDRKHRKDVSFVCHQIGIGRNTKENYRLVRAIISTRCLQSES